MKNKVPKAECEKCKHLKLMTEEKVIICDYLNAFHKALFTMAWNKPYLCPNFERRVENERRRKAY